ncbi:hypothetical protein D3C80_1633840 [compost metagenome]
MAQAIATSQAMAVDVAEAAFDIGLYFAQACARELLPHCRDQGLPGKQDARITMTPFAHARRSAALAQVEPEAITLELVLGAYKLLDQWDELAVPCRLIRFA